jgi:hypothetical protein
MNNLKFIILFILIGICASCDNEGNDDTLTLSGIYTETSPVNERSQLNFVEGNIVVKTESGSSVEDEFIYELIGNTIKLTPTWNNLTETKFEIQIINNSKFEIENLYPSIPEKPTTYLTFEK